MLSSWLFLWGGSMTESVFKIYSDDPLVHYATTELPPARTKQQIDGVLAEYGIKVVTWSFDIPREVYVIFFLEEKVEGHQVKIPVKVVCPTIWDRARPRAHTPEARTEQINWKVSLRVMFWFIKTHLETTYAMQSGNVVGFLPFLMSSNPQKLLKDYILPQLNRFIALEDNRTKPAQQYQEPEIVTDAEILLPQENQGERQQ